MASVSDAGLFTTIPGGGSLATIAPGHLKQESPKWPQVAPRSPKWGGERDGSELSWLLVYCAEDRPRAGRGRQGVEVQPPPEAPIALSNATGSECPAK